MYQISERKVEELKIQNFTDKYVFVRKFFLLSIWLDMAQFKDPEMSAKVAATIKLLRNKKNISQEQMYVDTNLNVSRIESADNNISLGNLSKIAQYFEMQLSDFFKLVEKQK